MKLTIFGSSDDLIEIKGDISEEFTYVEHDTHPSMLFFSDGTILSVEYDAEGIWRFAPLAKGNASFSKHDGADPDKDYTDIVILDGDIRWVGHGTELAR